MANAPVADAITPAEYEIMRILWAQQAVTSKTVINTLNDKKQWHPSTIKTLLRRLTDKHYIKATREKNHYVYEPEIAEQDALTARIQSLMHSTCNTKAADVIITAINEATLDQAMKKRIRAALDQKPTAAVVHCQCHPGQCDCAHH